MTVAHAEPRTLRPTDLHHEARAVYGNFFGMYAYTAGRTACRYLFWLGHWNPEADTLKHNVQPRKSLSLITHIMFHCQVLQSKPFGQLSASVVPGVHCRAFILSQRIVRRLIAACIRLSTPAFQTAVHNTSFKNHTRRKKRIRAGLDHILHDIINDCAYICSVPIIQSLLNPKT